MSCDHYTDYLYSIQISAQYLVLPTIRISIIKTLQSNQQMDPYFSSFAYPTPLSTQQAYSQPSIAQQGHSYSQGVNSIESMYTTVQPYNNKEFLLSTFGSRPQYIQIFLTLSHEDKLKMYLLMQQKKLYKEITDKEAYQKILKQIAQKLHNYNAFHQIQQKPSHQQQKNHDLQSKIDSICQFSFQKLNFPKIGAPTATQEELGDQEQWVESTVEQDQTQKQTIINNKAASYQKAENQFNSFYTSQSNKENVKTEALHFPSANPVFNIFNVDYEMERAMTKQIGLRKPSQMQKMSIWQLQVQQAQVKKYQPNIHQIFKKKQSGNQNDKITHETLPQQNNISFVPSSEPQTFDLYAQYNKQPNYQPRDNQNHIPQLYPSQFHQGSNELQATNFQNFEFNFNQMPTISYAPNTAQQLQIQQQPANTNKDNWVDNEQQWEQGQQEQGQIIHNNEYQQIAKLDQLKATQPFVFESHPFTVTPVSPNDNLFDFDALDMKVEVQPVINNSILDLYLSSSTNQEQQSQINNMFQANLNLEVPSDVVQTVVDLQICPPASNLNSQLFLPDNQKKYQIIDHLKIELGQGEKSFILKGLKNKSFQCNTQFYLTIINHLRDLSLQHTPQFQHFNEQYKIAKEIHQLTAKYTTVVDEEDEEKVEKALRETKKLYNKIYNQSNLTQRYTQSIMNEKNKEKGVQYKLGRVLIDSCINIDLIIRASSQQNRKNVFNSFCLLYILQKTNSLNKLKNYAQLVIAYTNQQLDAYKLINEEMLRQAEEHSDKYPSIITYIKGLLKIVSICERLIALVKSCFIKISGNIVKTLKNCKDIKSRFGTYIQNEQTALLFPPVYGLILKQGTQRNRTLYDLHLQFSQMSEKSPICHICLLQVGEQGEEFEEKGWYHYSCFNLIKSISSLDYI